MPVSWSELPSLTLLDLGSNVGVCGGQPPWRAGTQVGGGRGGSGCCGIQYSRSA